MKITMVIPARMASTRFPGKPLVDLCGKPMVQWVYEAALSSGVTERVLVATPDNEVVEACRAFGAPAVLTKKDHVSGTDRIAEVAEMHVADVYINVQGDEPLVSTRSIQACAKALHDDQGAAGSSVWCLCPDEEADNPNVVKVVMDSRGRALYFSRYPLPYARSARVVGVKKHIGVYGYRRASLLAFPSWPVGSLEAAESLEQLRFLENGAEIAMAEGEAGGLAIDTPEQADAVRAVLASTMT